MLVASVVELCFWLSMIDKVENRNALAVEMTTPYVLPAMRQVMAISNKHNIQTDHAVFPGYRLGISHKIDVEMITGSTQHQAENHRIL